MEVGEGKRLHVLFQPTLMAAKAAFESGPGWKGALAGLANSDEGCASVSVYDQFSKPILYSTLPHVAIAEHVFVVVLVTSSCKQPLPRSHSMPEVAKETLILIGSPLYQQSMLVWNLCQCIGYHAVCDCHADRGEMPEALMLLQDVWETTSRGA